MTEEEKQKEKELIDKIRVFGSLGYSPEQIANLLGFNKSARAKLYKDLVDEDHPRAIAYQRGFMTSEYKTDVSLVKAANSGDIDSIELLAKREKEREFKNLKKQLFGI